MKQQTLTNFINSDIPIVLKLQGIKYYEFDKGYDFDYVSLQEFNSGFINYACGYLDLINSQDYSSQTIEIFERRLRTKSPYENYNQYLYDIIESYLSEFDVQVYKNLKAEIYDKEITILCNNKDKTSVRLTVENFLQLLLDFVLDTRIIGVKENSISDYGKDFSSFNLTPLEEKISLEEMKIELKNNIPLFFISVGENEDVIKVIDKYDNNYRSLEELVPNDYIQCSVELRNRNKLIYIKEKHKSRVLNYIAAKL